MINIFDLPDDRLIELDSIIGPGNPIPVSKSTWFAWRKAHKAPQVVHLGPNRRANRVGDVKAMAKQTSTTTRAHGSISVQGASHD